MKFPLFLLGAILLAQTLALSSSPTTNVCLLPSKPRGTPQSLILFSSCGEGYNLNGNDYCYGCAEGYVASSTFECLKACREFSTLKEAEGLCRQDIGNYKYGPFSTKSSCEMKHEKCTFNGDGYIPLCSGIDLVLSWYCKTETGPREILPTRKSLACEKGYEQIDGICYPRCSTGYQGVGKVCVSGRCPSGYTQCGKYCVKGTSCEGSQIESFEASLASAQKEAERNYAQFDYSKYLC